MAKDIDDILSDLGIGSDAKKTAPKKTHNVDRSERSFSPLPAMPSGQRRFGADGKPIDDDPAVKGKQAAERRAIVGSASSTIYTPEEGLVPASEAASDLGELLVARGIVDAERVAAAALVVRQTPGTSIADVLIEQGADEADVQHSRAEMAGVPFERIDLESGLDGGVDGRLIQRLGVDFCKERSVVPLREEGSRVVIGATNPDDVFVLDEIRSRLGVNSTKLVLVTASDVSAAIDLVGGEESEDMDLNDILADVDEGDVEVAATDSQEAVDLEAKAGESPVIRYVNYIIHQAVKQGAS